MKRFFCLTLLAMIAVTGFAQSMNQKLKEKYGEAYERSGNGKIMYSIRKGGKYGVCDSNGQEIIPPEFDYTSFHFDDDYVEAIKDKQVSVYDLK